MALSHGEKTEGGLILFADYIAKTGLNPFLLVGGIGSLIASALHIAIIFGGPSWYRFFGAGEKMAKMAEAKNPLATGITLGIAGVLAVWGIYGFNWSKLIKPLTLPYAYEVLNLIALAYGLRGLVIVWAILAPKLPRRGFWIWSSLICLGLSLSYFLGTFVSTIFLIKR